MVQVAKIGRKNLSPNPSSRKEGIKKSLLLQN